MIIWCRSRRRSGTSCRNRPFYYFYIFFNFIFYSHHAFQAKINNQKRCRHQLRFSSSKCTKRQNAFPLGSLQRSSNSLAAFQEAASWQGRGGRRERGEVWRNDGKWRGGTGSVPRFFFYNNHCCSLRTVSNRINAAATTLSETSQ